MMSNENNGLVNYALVKFHIVFAMTYLVIVMLMGLIYSLQLLQINPLPELFWLSPRQVWNGTRLPVLGVDTVDPPPVFARAVAVGRRWAIRAGCPGRMRRAGGDRLSRPQTPGTGNRPAHMRRLGLPRVAGLSAPRPSRRPPLRPPPGAPRAPGPGGRRSP